MTSPYSTSEDPLPPFEIDTHTPVEIDTTPALELAIIVPTLNERANVPILLKRLEQVLKNVCWEVVFVDDDSRDGTAALIRSIAARKRYVHVIQRIGRRGLSTACIEGMLATAAPVLAVMDADLQHDESLLPEMLQEIQAGGIDLAVASRYTEGGSLGDFSDSRARISRIATKLSRVLVKADLADPMSGFFMIRREAFETAVRRMSGQGFKILLDLFASSPAPVLFREFPYRFRERQYGESKLDALVVWEYLMLVADKLIGRIVPVRFISFLMIGGLGVLVNLLTLRLSLQFGASFASAATAGTIVAMVSNFLLNNQLTYRDRRLRGVALLRGLVVFLIGCSIGGLAGVGVSINVFGGSKSWWLAGLAGAAAGAVWNYAIASNFTWKSKR